VALSGLPEVTTAGALCDTSVGLSVAIGPFDFLVPLVTDLAFGADIMVGGVVN
jgi:hypothetical protein